MLNNKRWAAYSAYYAWFAWWSRLVSKSLLATILLSGFSEIFNLSFDQNFQNRQSHKIFPIKLYRILVNRTCTNCFIFTTFANLIEIRNESLLVSDQELNQIIACSGAYMKLSMTARLKIRLKKMISFIEYINNFTSCLLILTDKGKYR